MTDYIEIDVHGLDESDVSFSRFIAYTSNLLPFWPKLVPLFIGWMRSQFDTRGSYGGDPWEPLSDKYAAWKTQRYPGKGILVATGDLKKAASKPKRFPTPTSLILRVDDSGYKHGDEDPHSVLPFHQKGTTKMPARPLLFERLPAPALAEVEEAARDYVEEALRVSGLRGR